MKEQACQVFTLGDDHTWRNIQGIGFHLHFSPPICINGVTYYRANKENRGSNYFLVSFDVSSEKLSRLEALKTLIDHWCTLIKYQGKLGFICCQKGVEIWVMEDSGKKQEWSKIIFYDMEGFEKWHIGGVTHGGEQGRRHITKRWGSCPG
ncbi:unnamed protein product [Arabis nemorensis]|uniref:F-box associated beta-propeller type 3 domain-containing protein n=1 Tax=Arabis nemorensis TaxID=586526 RepID=A0A565CKN7_9BRAS|nr:unnamed protein product [Arabis nemorensis]